jgi:hypothetical protein
MVANSLRAEPLREAIEWLLEVDNPGVRLRTLTGLYGLSGDDEQVREARRLVVRTLPAARDLTWMEMKGQAVVYGLTALAEAGLSREDVPVEPAVNQVLSTPFDANCGELMALRALVMLGYGSDPRLERRLVQFNQAQLPDGGWLCLHRVRKMKKTPKSCIRTAMHGLLLAGELAKRGRRFEASEPLTGYFLRRRLFYRTGYPEQLVLNDHPGRRMIDVFFPIEFFRVGLPLLLEALAALGAGQTAELREAWDLLDGKMDPLGRIPLEGTLPLNKAYLPRERVGKPSKWGTLYALLAWRSKLAAGHTL